MKNRTLKEHAKVHLGLGFVDKHAKKKKRRSVDMAMLHIALEQPNNHTPRSEYELFYDLCIAPGGSPSATFQSCVACGTPLLLIDEVDHLHFNECPAATLDLKIDFTSVLRSILINRIIKESAQAFADRILNYKSPLLEYLKKQKMYSE